MKTRKHPLATAAAVVATVVTLGCLSRPPGATAPDGATPPQYGLTDLGQRGVCDHSAFLRELRLTADQAQALRVVLKDAMRDTNPMMALLRDLTTRRATEAGALAAGLDTLMKMDAAQDAHTMGQLRAILTPLQGARLAEAVRRFPATHAHVLSSLADRATAEATRRFALTPSQQALFATAAGSYEAFWQAHREAYTAAMAQHLLEGDEAKLRANLAGLADKLATGTTVAFLASLSHQQRHNVFTAIDQARHRIVRAVGRCAVGCPRQLQGCPEP